MVLNICPPGTFVYSVRQGDTLWLLADRFNTTVEDILNLNPGIDPDRLAIGQQLCIPMIESDIDFDPVIDLNNLSRSLWSEHLFWSDNIILGIIFAPTIVEAMREKGLENAADFAEMFLDYYGRDFAEKFKDLLIEHLQLGADLTKAAKANDQEKFTTIDRDWFQNADNIARLLSENNPFWNYDEWREMLYTHLQMLKNYVSYLLTASSNQLGDILQDLQMQALAMADYMAEGIMRQFPEDFDE